MADNETLGASFSIDVTNLKAGLAQANRLIKESESEFKAAAAGMDNWAASEEGLNAKIASLNSITEIQRQKVDALQSEYDNLIANGLDPASKEAVELRTKINNETTALNKNEAELKKQTKALEELGNETDEAGDAAEDAADGFTVLKGAAANLVSEGITRLIDGGKEAITTLLNLTEETKEYRTELAKLETTATTAGASTDYIKDKWIDLASVLGDEGAVAEGLNNLMTAGFTTEKTMDEITSHLEGAAIKWKDTLKFEGLSDGLQETLATGKSVGAFAELLERAGKNLEDFDEGLAKCTTSAEQQNYVLDELSKLGLSDVSQKYREQNEELINSNKMTAEYTDTLAELGEALEPVNNDITAIKTELAEEFVPVIRDQVAPAMKDFTDSIKEGSAIEVTGKIIGFLAENFDTLATSALTAITVYETLSAAMKVSTAITNTATAVQGLSEGVGFATKMQAGWNAAMSANPIGAVLTAVGLLTTGILLLATQMDDTTESTDLLTESQRNTVTAAEEAATAFRDTTEAAAEMAAAESAQVDNAQKLWGELQTLADTNGKVQESDRARADFILGELNNALGTEYSMTGNIINNYKDMVTSIEKVIETKKAQILLEAYEESYAEAIKNVGEAEKARAIQAQELAAQEKVYEDARQKAITARAELDEKAANVKTEADGSALASDARVVQSLEIAAEKERGILETKQSKYSETDASVKGYYDNINSYETASTLLLEGETAKAIGHLTNYGSGFQTAASVARKSKDEQLEILRDQVINTEIQLGLLEADYENAQGNMTEEEKKQAKLRIENARKQAEDAKDEYYKVGGNMVEGMKKGAEDDEWKLTGALKKIVENGLKAAKIALGIKSPSRRYREEVAKPSMQGWAGGIDKYKKLVLTAQTKASNEMLESELHYLNEKERIEKEKSDKELAEKIANAKFGTDIEKLKQEHIQKEAEDGQQKYLDELEAKANEEKEIRAAKLDAIKGQFEEEEQVYKEHYDNLVQARQDVADLLYDDTNKTFVTKTFDYGDGETETFYELTDFSADNEKLIKYADLLDDLIEKYGELPGEIITNLAGMTVDDGTKYVTAMLSASEAAWNEYVNGFAERNDIANRIGAALFPDEALEDAKITMESYITAASEMLTTVLDDTALSVADSIEKIQAAADNLAASVRRDKKGVTAPNEQPTVNQYNYFQQAVTSRMEQYKSNKLLNATIRQAMTGA